MAQLARIDWQIRANCLILASRFRVPELNPFFANRASGGPKIAGLRRFARIDRTFWMRFFFSRANCPDSCCELLGHLRTLISATKMTGRPGHWSEPCEYNILFLGSILVISSQDSSALGYREFTQEGPMTISPFAAREGTSAPQWPNVKKCCRHLVPSSDFFVQSYAVPIICKAPRHKQHKEECCLSPEPAPDHTFDLQNGHCLGTPNPHNLSNNYCRTSPISTAVRPQFVTLCLAGFYLSLEERGMPQYTSHLYRQYFWWNKGGWGGFRKVLDKESCWQ